MEIILNSNEHKISDNRLRLYFQQNTRFINKNISLNCIIFYIYFPNIMDYKMTIKYNNQDHAINFNTGAYNISDISNIINLEIKDNFNLKEDDNIKSIVDVNRYVILIIVKENFKLILDKNFVNMLGFSKYVIDKGYYRSDKIPNIH